MNLTKKQVREYAKAYPHITAKDIEYKANDYKTERGFVKWLTNANAEAEEEHNKPLPIYIKLEVEWKRSTMWGYNPSVDMRWKDANGEWHYMEKAGCASGCGYDKHSAAVASALNKHFKNLLYSIRNKRTTNKPYGISYYEGSFPSFEGGVGMECYPKIFQWLGFEMRHVANSDTYDKWVIVKKSERKRFSLI